MRIIYLLGAIGLFFLGLAVSFLSAYTLYIAGPGTGVWWGFPAFTWLIALSFGLCAISILLLVEYVTSR